MDAGDYVPDSVTNNMVRDRLVQQDARHGWILDGYPRTPAQVEELDTFNANTGVTLDLVLMLGVPEPELVRRLLERAATEGRADDTEEVIRHRQQVYNEQTAPLLTIYKARGLLQVVDGRGDVAEVAQRCLKASRRVAATQSA